MSSCPRVRTNQSDQGDQNHFFALKTLGHHKATPEAWQAHSGSSACTRGITAALFSHPLQCTYPAGWPAHVSAVLATLTRQEYSALMVAAGLLDLPMQRGSGNF